LEDAATYDEYVRSLALHQELFEHRTAVRVADRHPEYLSTKLARERSEADGLPLLEVQHHHAHVASCLAENGVPLGTRPILGISLDGLGLGDDGTIWGGEFLIADYRAYQRVGTFKPVAMLGGAQAVYEPWRNTYAHLVAELGWPRFAMNFAGLDLFRFLDAKPRATLDRMLAQGVNSPLASSCGRLFDAVAAALDLCRERVGFEGQAAMELEALVDPRILDEPLAEEGSDQLYPFAVPLLPGKEGAASPGLPYVEPLAAWQAILGDLILGTPKPVMAARFHRGLARVLGRMAAKVLSPRVEAGEADPRVALSGGCFQNRILLELTLRELEANGFEVLTHASIPANDGGLSLGQAAIAAASMMGGTSQRREESCA
ncbi:MAG: carbamoyltransferase HypF, partial [Acidobacteria bacterium]|nr:carbamoyltransferase HypF [Acidobacteriota bacterium]